MFPQNILRQPKLCVSQSLKCRQINSELLGRSQFHVMPYYILVTEEQEVDIYTTPEMLTTQEIQDLVGIEGEPATFEVLDSSNFSDPKIVIICDDDVEPKGLKPTCVTKNGGVIFGQVLILATNNSLHDLCLLDLTQAKMVKEQVKLHPKPKPKEDFSASLWD